MSLKLSMIFLLILSLILFNSIHAILITSILVGVILKNQSLKFLDAFIYAFTASIIATITRSIYMPSINLFGDIFGGLPGWVLICISITFTAFTSALLIKTAYELVNWK